MSEYPCGEARNAGERTEDRYLLPPFPPGDCAGRVGAGECRPGRIIPELLEGDGLESGRWYDPPPLATLALPPPEPPPTLPELPAPDPVVLLVVPVPPPDTISAGECPVPP